MGRRSIEAMRNHRAGTVPCVSTNRLRTGGRPLLLLAHPRRAPWLTVPGEPKHTRSCPLTSRRARLPRPTTGTRAVSPPPPRLKGMPGSLSNLRENVRTMPSAAWVLLAGTFVNRLGTFVLPFITLYLTRRGFSAPQAGLAVAMYGLGGFAAQLFGGLLHRSD